MTIAVLGEALIDFIASDDGSYRPHLGGSPYNVAIALARQGIGVSYMSPFSDDTFGAQLKDAMKGEGVNLPITRRSLWPTSLALVTIDESGMPTYRIYREGIADKDVSFDEIQAILPSDLKVFHTGSLAITPSQLPKMKRLFALMRDRSVTVSLDVNIRLRASIDTDAYINGVRSLLPLADIVKASDEDLEPFRFGKYAVESAKQAYSEMGSGILVLTTGKDGAVLFAGDRIIERPSYAVKSIADTVGAGDTFHAAFLASLYRNGLFNEPAGEINFRILGSAVDFACAAAAVNVTRVGCSPPTPREVESFMNANRKEN